MLRAILGRTAWATPGSSGWVCEGYAEAFRLCFKFVVNERSALPVNTVNTLEPT